MAITNKYFLDEQGLSTVANHIKERLKTVSTMPATAGDGTVLLYKGATSGSYTNGHIYQYSTTTNSWVDISPSGGDLSNYIQKSSTAGLVKNDGSIDENTYVDNYTLEETVGWVSCNLIHVSFDVVSQEINGITFTINRNSDNEVTSITANGTASADAVLQLWNTTDASTFYNKYKGGGFTLYNAGTYGTAGYILGTSYEKSGMTYAWETDSSTMASQKVYDVDFPYGSSNCHCYIKVTNGTVCNNISFKPMMTLSSVTIDKFYPYHESVEDYIENLKLDDISNVNITSPSNDQVLKYDSASGEWINGSGGGGGGGHTMSPTPSASLTEATVVSTINGATGTNEEVTSLYSIQKWTNEKSIRRIMDGSIAGTLISATGIGTWDDALTPDETDWWYDAAFIIPDNVNTDNIDVSVKFDPGSGETIALGGYILDTTTGKICIKFANEIVNISTAKVAVDIKYLRNEVE